MFSTKLLSLCTFNAVKRAALMVNYSFKDTICDFSALKCLKNNCKTCVLYFVVTSPKCFQQFKPREICSLINFSIKEENNSHDPVLLHQITSFSLFFLTHVPASHIIQMKWSDLKLQYWVEQSIFLLHSFLSVHSSTWYSPCGFVLDF